MSELEPYQTNHPSKVPSWVGLGFVVGAFSMWWFQSEDPTEVPEPEPFAVVRPTPQELAAKDPNPLEMEGRPSMEIVEALFDTFQDYAFWSDDRTEIAIWNSQTLSFSDHFSVVRTDEGLFFRSIPQFTRLPLEGYGPESSPILFTETAEQMAKRFYKANPDKVPKKGLRTPVDFDELPQPPTPGGR